MQCPIARSLDQTGDWWSMLILRNAFLGARRFHDFEELLGIAPNTLTRRLAALTEHGLLRRYAYTERPRRYAYALTEKGQDFLPVLLSLAAWGNRWLAQEGVAIECVCATTGAPVEPALVDRRTGRALGPGMVALRAGPAARRRLRRGLEAPVVLGAEGVLGGAEGALGGAEGVLGGAEVAAPRAARGAARVRA